MNNFLKHIGDICSAGALACATAIHLIPTLLGYTATALSIVWTLIQMYLKWKEKRSEK